MYFTFVDGVDGRPGCFRFKFWSVSRWSPYHFIWNRCSFICVWLCWLPSFSSSSFSPPHKIFASMVGHSLYSLRQMSSGNRFPKWLDSRWVHFSVHQSFLHSNRLIRPIGSFDNRSACLRNLMDSSLYLNLSYFGAWLFWSLLASFRCSFANQNTTLITTKKRMFKLGWLCANHIGILPDCSRRSAFANFSLFSSARRSVMPLPRPWLIWCWLGELVRLKITSMPFKSFFLEIDFRVNFFILSHWASLKHLI